MKLKRSVFAALALSACASPVMAQPFIYPWTGGASGTGRAYHLDTNWGLVGNIPGSLSVTTNEDIAEFQAAGSSGFIDFNFGASALGGSNLYLGRLQMTAASGPRTFGAVGSTSGYVVLNGYNNIVLNNASSSLMTINQNNGSGSAVLTLKLTSPTSKIIADGDILIQANLTESSFGLGINKTGNGTLYYTGSNIYTGTTTITNGTLQVGNGGTTGSLSNGSVNITANGTLGFKLDNTTTSIFSNNISGAGSMAFDGVDVSGHSSYQLSGDNSAFSGDIRIGQAGSSASRLTVNSGLRLGTAVVTVNTGSSLFLNGGTYANTFNINGKGWSESAGTFGALRMATGAEITGNVVLQSGATVNTYASLDTGKISGAISGGSSLTKAGDGTLILSGTNTHTGGTSVSAGTLQLGDGGTTGSLTGNIVLAGTGTFAVNRSNNLTLSNQINGIGAGIDKLGANTLTISGSNTFDGSISVSAGTLKVSNASALGQSSNNLFIQGSSFLDANGFNIQVGTLTGPGTLYNTSATPVSIFIGNGVTSGTDTYSGNISQPGGGVVSLIKYGTGTQILTGGSSYTGGTTIFGGILVMGDTTLGGSITGNVSVGPGAEFSIRRNGVTFAGDISGFGKLSTHGAAFPVTLSGNNTYSGGTNVNAGGLVVSSANSLGKTNSDLYVAGSAYLDVKGFDFTFNALSGGGTIKNTGASNSKIAVSSGNFSGVIGQVGAPQDITLTKTGSGTLVLLGDNTGYSGGTSINTGVLQIGDGVTDSNLAGTVTNNAELRMFTASAQTISSTIGGSGLVRAVAGVETATVTLSGNNTYTGGTYVSGGVLKINHNNALGSSSGTLTIDGGLDLRGRTIDVGALNNAIIPGTAFITNTSPSAAKITVGNGNTSGEFWGVITDAGGALSFTKVGTGTMVLMGNNTYSGTTTVSNGILQLGKPPLSGSPALPGDISVGANGTLIIRELYTHSLPGNITGSGNIDIDVALDTITLSGNNSGFSGLMKVTSGTVNVGNANALGSSTVSVRVNDYLNLSGNSVGVGSLFGTGTIDSFPTAATLTVGNGDAGGTFSGDLIIPLTKVGTGTMILSGSSTGNKIISGGILQMGDGGTGGSLGAGTVVLSNNASLVFNRSIASGTPIIANVISGNGNVSQIGEGITLTSNNTYSGTTTISDGFLTMGNGGTTGTVGLGAVIDNASFRISRSDNITFSNVISGTGSLGKLAAGTTTLTGANSYSGGTNIAGGILQVGNGGTTGVLGTGDVVFTNNSSLVFNRSDTVTIPQDMSGAGSLTKAGNGTLIVTGLHSFSGGTTISAGTLRYDDGSTTAGPIANSGALIFNRSSNFTLNISISGNGTVTQSGTGKQTFAADNTYTGTTTISAGILQIGNGGAAGSLGNSAVVNNAALILNRSDTYTVPKVISGTGDVYQNGAGTTIFNDLHTYSGTTTINAGTLQINEGGNLGTGNVVNNGVLAYNQTTNTTLAAVISGNGSFSKLGSSTLTLTGTNLYSGGTLINGGGILKVGNTTALGATTGSLTVTGGDTLDINSFTIDVGAVNGAGTITNSNAANAQIRLGNGDTSGIFSGVIKQESGAGTVRVTKAGTGTETLSGANTYLGVTRVLAGNLIINGNQVGATGAINVDAGATLGGSGTLGGTVTINGTLSPGNSPGKMIINNDLIFGNNSTFFIEMNGTTAGTQYDQVALTSSSSNYVIGTNVTLSGDRLGTFVAPFLSSYVIVNNSSANAGTGTFAGLPEGAFFPFDGQVFQIHYNVGTYNVDGTGFHTLTAGGSIVIAAVPEPATIFMLVLATLGTGGFLAYRRYQQHKLESEIIA